MECVRTEKTIKDDFMRNQIDTFKNLIDVDNLRLYGMELPVKTPDGTKFADVILEVESEGSPMTNKMMVLEFKKGNIDYNSVVAQVLRYSEYLQKQLYRKKKVTPFILAEGFSEWERRMAKDNGVFCVQYDTKWNLRLLN